jgi:hypothetical protein
MNEIWSLGTEIVIGFFCIRGPFSQVCLDLFLILFISKALSWIPLLLWAATPSSRSWFTRSKHSENRMNSPLEVPSKIISHKAARWRVSWIFFQKYQLDAILVFGPILMFSSTIYFFQKIWIFLNKNQFTEWKNLYSLIFTIFFKDSPRTRHFGLWILKYF